MREANNEILHKCLENLIECSTLPWTHAIVWQCRFPRWSFHGGFCRGAEAVGTDSERFFKISMDQRLGFHDDLPGHASMISRAVWVTDTNGSMRKWERCRWGRVFGIRTFLCIPLRSSSVLELASTEIIHCYNGWEQDIDLDHPALQRLRFPFTPSQWEELEHQALIFKYIISAGYNYLQMDLHEDRKIDPEQGRCRRIGGKKKSCSKEDYPDSKNDEMLHETTENEKQNRGKEKISVSKCSWPSLTESSDSSIDTTSSYSSGYSCPS
ncbi:hypothetical protein VNO78_30440 [Psophocarpus tetragonolobus]|uniref:Transcription factor n=1 Tax=Psophocarpus tetragonolobus TaxID=3891 RepID=A0AAN9RWL4_PSOTE